MPNDHIVKSYDQQINLLTRKIIEMGGLVEQQLAAAIDALVSRNLELAARVIEQDDRVDDLEEEIDTLAIRLFATRQPMAVDLRLIAMAMKVSNDLERIGDYATNIAKAAARLAKVPPLKPLYTIPRMGQMVTGDAESYQYLVESIRKFPPPAAFARMIEEAGFKRVTHRPLTAGVVAIHSGWKI